MRGKGKGVPKPDAKHNYEEQEIIGGFGQFRFGKPSEIDVWRGAIDSAERAVGGEPGESIGLLVELCKSDPDPRLQLIGELLSRYPLARRRGKPIAAPVIYAGGMPAQQTRLQYWGRVFRERAKPLQEKIAATPAGSMRRDLEDQFEELIDGVADEGKLSRETFRNHLNGDHGPSQAWDRKQAKAGREQP